MPAGLTTLVEKTNALFGSNDWPLGDLIESSIQSIQQFMELADSFEVRGETWR